MPDNKDMVQFRLQSIMDELYDFCTEFDISLIDIWARHSGRFEYTMSMGRRNETSKEFDDDLGLEHDYKEDSK